MRDGRGQSEPEEENYKLWEGAISPSEEKRSDNSKRMGSSEMVTFLALLT
jgi:hypothetical protein